MKKNTRTQKAAAKPVRDRARAQFKLALPLQGAERMRGAYSQVGYHAARVAARDGRTPVGGSGDFHLRYDRERLANQAREFGRDNGLFQGPIDQAAGYIVGTGFNLQCRTEDEGWNAAAEAYKKRAWENPEISGVLCGFQVEELAIKELLSMGDFAAIKTTLGKLQIIESEQIRGRTPQNMDGLRRDSNGTVTGFWIAPYGQHGNVDYPNAREFRAEDVLYALKPDRPSSKRGVPPLQAAFSMLHRLNDILDSEAIARQLQARMAIIVNKENAGVSALGESVEDPDKVGLDGQIPSRIQEVDNGIIFHGEVGETVTGMDRTAPGNDFDKLINTFMRLVGLPLGLPLELTLLDWTKGNYSQSRAVLEQVFKNFVRWQMLLELRFYRPLWKWMVDLAVADKSDNGLSPREDMYAHEWIKPSFPWIDQSKEAQAWGAKVDRGFCTHAQVLKSLDKERADVVAVRQAEVEDGIKRKLEIEAKYPGVKVPYEIFCGLEASVNAGKNEEERGREAKPAEDDEEAKATVPTPVAATEPAALPVADKPERRVFEIAERDDKGRAKVIVERKLREGA